MFYFIFFYQSNSVKLMELVQTNVGDKTLNTLLKSHIALCRTCCWCVN